jgi:hypothetical protein
MADVRSLHTASGPTSSHAFSRSTPIFAFDASYSAAASSHTHSASRITTHSSIPRSSTRSGTRDILPVLAETSTLGYGSGGTYGFRRPGVRDRWHNGKAHSDFLTEAFCARFWTPYLRDRTITEDDPIPERPPAWIALVRLVQPRFLVIILVAVALWWVSQRQWWP